MVIEIVLNTSITDIQNNINAQIVLHIAPKACDGLFYVNTRIK